MDNILDEVVASARMLTGARYGVLTTLDPEGQFEEFRTSGVRDEERFFEYFVQLPGSLRGANLPQLAAAYGLPALRPPMPLGAFLTAPFRHRGQSVGSIFLANTAEDAAFSRPDEKTLVLLASQPAFVIANAHTHREEQHARATLHALINISPVGVVVFNAASGAPVWINREVRPIVRQLRILRPAGRSVRSGPEIRPNLPSHRLKRHEGDVSRQQANAPTRTAVQKFLMLSGLVDKVAECLHR